MNRPGLMGLFLCLFCAVFWVGVGMYVYHQGVVAGRREIVQQYAHQVQRMGKIVDHSEIKSMLSEGRR